jgi:hypothetical protein
MDGSFVYQSHKGVLNLDNIEELQEARREDEAFLRNMPKIPLKAERDSYIRGSQLQLKD